MMSVGLKKIGFKVNQLLVQFVWATAHCALFFAVAGMEAAQAALEKRLAGKLALSGDQQTIAVILRLPDNLSIYTQGLRPFSRSIRKQAVAMSLVNAAASQQQILLADLHKRQEKGQVENVRSLWIINAISLETRVGILRRINQDYPQLLIVEDQERNFKLQQPNKLMASVPGFSAIAGWNLAAVSTADLWSMGYYGQGTLIAMSDTGFDVKHPLLSKSQFYGGAGGWCNATAVPADPLINGNCPELTLPSESALSPAHGTMTGGVMVAGSGQYGPIGVAPRANWMGAQVFDNGDGVSTEAFVLNMFQWLLLQNSAPDVLNMSWGYKQVASSCTGTILHDAIKQLRLAGIFLVASSGNDGSVSLPAAFAEVTAVGSSNELSQVSTFSGGGESFCIGRDLTQGEKPYPDFLAPGEHILTTDKSDGGNENYEVVVGTSFSSPLVAGGIAVLLSAFPELTADEFDAAIKAMVAKGTMPLANGQTVPNNNAGYGIFNLKAIFDQLLTTKMAKVTQASVKVINSMYQLDWLAAPDPGGGVRYLIKRGNVVIANNIASLSYSAPVGVGVAPTFQIIAVDPTGTRQNSGVTSVRLGDLKRNSSMTKNRVDAFDAVKLASLIGTTSATPGWDPRADLNGDNVIDIADMDILSQQIGQRF